MRLLDYLRRKLGAVRGAASPTDEPWIQTLLPDVLQWAKSFNVHEKDWLILGKGPSYQRISSIRLDDFYTCSLNHVVREHPVDLAHIIDIDVVDHCKESLERNARHLVLPYFPHVEHDPTKKTIEDFIGEMPVLRRLSEQGRLLWYNLSSASRQVGSSPVIVARFFSAEAAVNILAACGVRRIRSLGVDGGNAYDPRYNDLKAKTLLANRHPSFDRQFEEISRTIRRRGIFYAPLHKRAPIAVIIQEVRPLRLAAKVLEYSIRRHASMSVSFRRAGTPGSTSEEEGPAILFPADLLVLGDLAQVWDPSPGAARILHAADLPSEWSPSQRYERGKTRLLSYGAPDSRPWLSSSTKHGAPWYEALKEGMAEGFIARDELYQEVENGYVIPDLLRHLGLSPPSQYKRRVRRFTPPPPDLSGK